MEGRGRFTNERKECVKVLVVPAGKEQCTAKSRVRKQEINLQDFSYDNEHNFNICFIVVFYRARTLEQALSILYTPDTFGYTTYIILSPVKSDHDLTSGGMPSVRGSFSFMHCAKRRAVYETKSAFDQIL